MATADQLARQAQAERLPWVRRLRKPVPCQGIKHGRLAGARAPGGARGVDHPDVRCSRQARWHYAALGGGASYLTGDFCFTHLVSQGLYGDGYETRRTERWFARHTIEEGPVADDDMVLDLSKDEDLAVVLALVPDWPELADGLDLILETEQDLFRERLQAAVDTAIEALAAEAAVLTTLPPPEQD